MAQTYSTELTGIDSVPAVKPSATAGYGARVRRYRATFTLASQPTGAGNELVVADLPAGVVPAFFVVTPSVTLGSSTLAFGTAASSAAYAAAAAYTATTGTLVSALAAVSGGAALASTTRVLATIAAAALPASGTLVIDVYATSPN